MTERAPFSTGWQDHMTDAEKVAYDHGDIYQRERIRRRAKGRAIYHNSKPKKIDYEAD